MFDNGVLLALGGVLGILGVKVAADAVTGSSDSTSDTRWWGSYDELDSSGSGSASRRRNSKGHFVSR